MLPPRVTLLLQSRAEAVEAEVRAAVAGVAGVSLESLTGEVQSGRRLVVRGCISFSQIGAHLDFTLRYRYVVEAGEVYPGHAWYGLRCGNISLLQVCNCVDHEPLVATPFHRIEKLTDTHLFRYSDAVATEDPTLASIIAEVQDVWAARIAAARGRGDL